MLFRESLSLASDVYEETDLNLIKAKNNLAILLARNGQVPEARKLIDYVIRHVEKVSEESPYAATALLASSATVKSKMGDYPGAADLMQRVVDARREQLGNLHPSTTQALNNLGFLLMTLGAMTEAKQHLDRALELNPKLGWGHEQKGGLLMQAGRLDDALVSFDAALQYDSRSVQAWLYSGLIETERKRWGEGRRRLGQALRMQPNLGLAHFALAMCEMELGELDQARRSIDRAKALNVSTRRIDRAEARLAEIQQQSQDGAPQ